MDIYHFVTHRTSEFILINAQDPPVNLNLFALTFKFHGIGKLILYLFAKMPNMLRSTWTNVMEFGNNTELIGHCALILFIVPSFSY